MLECMDSWHVASIGAALVRCCMPRLCAECRRAGAFSAGIGLLSCRSAGVPCRLERFNGCAPGAALGAWALIRSQPATLRFRYPPWQKGRVSLMRVAL